MPISDVAIDVTDLRKSYRGAADGTGLNGIDLRVPAGSVCGLLGPNGAGKTTTVRVLSTLLRFDSGTVRVAGYDVRREPRRVRERIGLVGQSAAVDEVLSGRQNLVMFGRLNGLAPVLAQRRADELLEQFDLAAVGRRPVGKYSGGMRRRLDLAAGLIVSPPLLFVDEPTTGLDPAARMQVWSAIEALVAAGTTVLLTTQYLEEADRLADRIVMLSHGRVIAEGSPADLKARVGADWLEVALADPADAEQTAMLAKAVATGEVTVDPQSHMVRIPVAGRATALVTMAVALRDAGIAPHDINVRRPSLDEVFIQLTATSREACAEVGRECAEHGKVSA
ncbi:ATP-binding cassette domain-containing protein [Nocardia sp. NEAU-G5]|uniref:ATP-binding cassette domain-containing protein n=1 Tax=Nocardia albiluteola TaxID=2842303 RepID=A0ABS6BC65_9NOCA|nr:ATP-binding cassette domain-containing protein [Nocardia albiluteola]MBU3067882.1 ATP-binding cassette domain-containing protein [Nocardia albiluteola]